MAQITAATPSDAKHGAFCTNRVVFMARAILVTVSTLREWMIAVCR